MNNIVIISGVTGMDGSHMLDYLLENTNHNIVGLVRRLSVKNWDNIEHNLHNDRFSIEECDITDPISVEGVIQKYKPDYFIHFAASSFVGNSWSQPVTHMNTNSMAVLYLLEAIRKYSSHTHFYQSGSSEMFGDVKYSPQDEKHPFSPRSVYGVSKCAAHHLIKVYRESYNLYCLSGFLFNHESYRRGDEFVTRKITKNVARIYHSIKNGKVFNVLELGSLDSKRDWSAAEDFVDGIWKMLNQNTDKPKEYVLSSNKTHTVREFVELAFKKVGINGEWVGKGIGEKFMTLPSNDGWLFVGPVDLVRINQGFFRPADVNSLHGDSSLARKELNWEPKISFDELVSRMVKWDIENYKE